MATGRLLQVSLERWRSDVSVPDFAALYPGCVTSDNWAATVVTSSRSLVREVPGLVCKAPSISLGTLVLAGEADCLGRKARIVASKVPGLAGSAAAVVRRSRETESQRHWLRRQSKTACARCTWALDARLFAPRARRQSAKAGFRNLARKARKVAPKIPVATCVAPTR